jgi:hypothetical protein
MNTRHESPLAWRSCQPGIQIETDAVWVLGSCPPQNKKKRTQYSAIRFVSADQVYYSTIAGENTTAIFKYF